PVLNDCQGAWGRQFEGWEAGATCGPYGPKPRAQNITCNEQGMITAMVMTDMNIQGFLPQSLGNLTSLTRLSLDHNSLGHSIPSSFVNLTNLRKLSLGFNRFMNGPIPEYIGSLERLETLDLGLMALTGSIPSTIGRLTNLTLLDVSINELNGSIPESIGMLTRLSALYIQQTYFSGILPPSLGNLTKLIDLNLNGTSLTCPPSGTSCEVQQHLNSAFCKACPDFCSICVAPPPAPPSEANSASQGGLPTAAIASIAAAAVAALLLATLIGALLWRRHRGGEAFSKAAPTSKVDSKGSTEAAASAAAAAAAAVGSGKEGVVVEVEAARADVCGEYSLEDMAAATGEWAERNRIGSGSFGDVYRGVNPHGGSEVWAVKRARVLTNDFQREVREMASKHHPNLVRLLGYCIAFDPATRTMEQILVYEFMPNHDLDTWIAPGAATPLSLRQRMDILIGVAKGLQYLHDFGIVHRDIKPANILLSSAMQAKIADFGLVKLNGGTAAGTTVAATRVMGTPGYVDPAYCKSHKATPMADVYSFGVVMLVVITGRKAVQEVEGGHVNLKQWVEPLVASNSIAAFKDPRLDAPDDILLRLARLALSCTAMPTASRPSMGKVLGELVAVRGEIVGEEVDKVASRIDSEIDTSSDLDFNASIARAHQIAMQSGSSDTV
ncbi:unnamed protein product, partial [Closterium sp. NIES-53]